jgi:uncharacterized protein with HEPN domain
MPADLATALDIVLACRRIGKFLSGATESRFLLDDEKRWAVVSQLILIGEAVRRLSSDFRQLNATIPWNEYAGMRNRLDHQYEAIDWSIVWNTATAEIPALLAFLEPQLPEEDS